MTKNLVMEKIITLAEAKAQSAVRSRAQEAEAGAEITKSRVSAAQWPGLWGHRAHVDALLPGDWGWTGTYDPSVLAPMTDDELREEGWPV